MNTTLLESLDGAQLVKFYNDYGLVAAWNGSLTVNIIDAETGETIDCFMMDDTTAQESDIDVSEIAMEIDEYIEMLMGDSSLYGD